MYYLDHAAATPLSKKALSAMRPYFAEQFFNPSSPYLPAVEIRDIYESAKDTIAHAIGAKGVDLIITSGATESINLAFSVAPDGPVLVSAAEHPAVVASASKTGNYDLIKVDKNGTVDLKDLESKITSKTSLVSVALVSSELGTIQPISKISAIIKTERERRVKLRNKTPIFLHCDASQGFGLVDIKVARLGVDLLTLNSAKMYGPKGVGALWVAHNVRLAPVIVGGGQESGLRSGTENVPGVIGFAAAVKDHSAGPNSEIKRLLALKKTLKSILSTDKEIIFLGDDRCQLASFLPISIPGLDAERLIYKLEEKGVYVSTGAACAASKGEKSKTLSAIGLSDSEIAGSLRLTLGKLNDEENIKVAGQIILETIAEERARG